MVQVYFEDKFASITRPEKLLVRFDKVQLNAGEEKTVRFTVTPGEDLSFTGINYQKIVEKGDFELMVGNSSDNIILRKGFYVAE
ncbi:fibronectin type III-like domain-contianing protein [Mariniphaga sediminis]|uniref:fibronectin type III-like domain-contianing protein n=1 Tax=Mariniphaga sediminis TaxID=1628158 RepID=UPI003565D8ED